MCIATTDYYILNRENKKIPRVQPCQDIVGIFFPWGGGGGGLFFGSAQFKIPDCANK